MITIRNKQFNRSFNSSIKLLHTTTKPKLKSKSHEFLTFESNYDKHEKLSNEKRDLILTILNSTATKREAKSYFAKYSLLEKNDIYKNKNKLITEVKPEPELKEAKREEKEKDNDTDILTHNRKFDKYIDNLLVKHSNTPTSKWSNDEPIKTDESKNEIKLTATIRTCFLRIKNLKLISKEILVGLATMLDKSLKLGVSPIIILDTKDKVETLDQINILMETMGDILPLRSIQGLFELGNENKIEIELPEMLGIPLFSGIIPIISPLVVDDQQSRMKCIDSLQIMQQTIKCLQNLNELEKRSNNDAGEFVTIEKIVFIDDVGGLPSIERGQSSHVLVNLLQEYNTILNELKDKCHLKKFERLEHVKNLKEMKILLDEVPKATGIITTPKMAAREEEKQVEKETNPIIYNILTDRPTISSSLPVELKKTPQLHTTILKKGMNIKIYLSNDPTNGLNLIEMEKQGKVDLNKLKHLIDDSFGRNLNLKHYLDRINGNVAGLIIAGDYEGGAIITWEIGNENEKPVAYLDKFAVVKKLQGIPGIADIVFKAMLNSFTGELLWRSRQNNPVNKWYFERSTANHCINGTQWRLFYAGEKPLTEKSLEGYSKICSSIKPSFDI